MDSVRKTVKWSLSCKKPEVSMWSHSLLGFFLVTPYQMHTKLLLVRSKVAKVIPCFYFWLVGRLGRSARMHCSGSSVIKVAFP